MDPTQPAPKPASSPLSDADRLATDAARVGFDWPDLDGVMAKVREELAELEEALARRQGPGDPAVRHELGDLLQALCNLGRWAGTPAEAALEEANMRFSRRYAAMERITEERGWRLEGLGAEELDGLWREGKRSEG